MNLRALCLYAIVIAMIAALAAPSGSAIAQLTNGSNEQQILTAPLGTSVVGEAASPRNELCGHSGQQNQEVAEACARAAVEVVASNAVRTLRENTLAIEALERQALLASSNNEHLLGALRSQARHSEIIFWVSMAVVSLGLLAAALQFWIVWQSQDSTPMEISVSEKQVTIKTAWIGVVLLAMSMGFLALYLLLVYQIEAI